MNIQTKYSIINILNKVEDGNFDQDDIKILLIDIRELTGGAEADLREIANFIAHPKRNRGLVFKELMKVYEHIYNTLDDSWGCYSDFDIVKTLIRGEGLINQLVNTIGKFNLFRDSFQCIKLLERSQEISICIVGLLTDAKIMVNGDPIKLCLNVIPPQSVSLLCNVSVSKNDKALSISWPIIRTQFPVSKEMVSIFPPFGRTQHFIVKRSESGSMVLMTLPE